MATVRTPKENLPSRTFNHVIRLLSLLFLVKYAQGQGPGGGRVIFKLPEGQPTGKVVGTIATQQGFTYTFNEINPYFQLNKDTGTITTLEVIDRESLPQNRIDLLIVGRHSGQSSSYPIEVSVEVLDINDNTPQFTQSSISVTIPENARKGTQTLIDTATDPDEGVNGTVGNYRIIAGNEDRKFILVEPQQLSPYMYIENRDDLDREIKDFYQLKISADDGGTPKKTGYLFINITVQDVNDNPPIFDHSDYTASINESAGAGTSVIRAHATDRDKGRNADITYSITDETNQFTIDVDTGEISNLVNADQLECHRECQRSVMSQCHARSCFITVEAHDGGTPSLTGRAYISVNLIDENDHEPNISFTHMPDNTKSYAAVDENVGLAQVVAIVSVLDADQGLNGQTMLTITRGNEQGHFKLLTRGSFNLIQVAGRLDRERTSVYNLTMLATDKGSPPKSSTAYLIIYVNDVNDHAPEFKQLSYSQTLGELVPEGTFVASVVATDLDSGVNADVTYTILSGDEHGWFKIDHSTGLVTTAQRLDYETTSRLTLNISAEDGAISPHRNFTSLTITIVDENDMVPTFSQPVVNVNITEGTVSPFHVATPVAQDGDQGQNGTVRYYLHPSVNDKYPGTFGLVDGTSRIETQIRLDREIVSRYTLLLIAHDQGTPSLSSTATVNVRVLDLNDNSPVFYPDQYYARVLENQPISTSVASIRCSDPDEGINAEIVYTISEGDRQSFSIDPASGLITTSKPLNREQRSTYSLTITAKDKGQVSRNAETSAIVHVIVADQNDELPVFSGKPYVFSIQEDGDGQPLQTGRQVGNVNATTRDKVGIIYAIVDGDPQSVFTINSMSGVIARSKKVDREVKAVYNLVIVATGGVMFSSAKATVIVEDMNDNSPVFPTRSMDVDVLENAGIGYDVVLAKATDKDDGPNSQISYTLQADPANTFSIRPDSGIIYVVKSLDVSVKKKYTMVVTASDAGTPRNTDTMTVHIHVKDVNDHTPTFPYQNYEVSLLESRPVNDKFFNLTATDEDFGPNGEILYNITRGNDGGSFGIFPNGILYVAHPLDRETRDFYRLTVSAVDQGEIPRSSSMNITVHILDANDNRPLFLNTTYTFFIQEGKLARTIIGSVSTKDNDIGRNAEISYSMSLENQNFSINLQTGEIMTLASFDREELLDRTGKDFVSFEIVATDNGMKRLEDRATVNVFVTDINDNPPIFSKPMYSIPLHEQAPVNSQVLKVSASDADNGLNSYISYSLISGDGLDKFSIDTASGVIILTSRIDRETKDLYHLTVLASDNGKLLQNSATALVRISVVDDNDNFPQFVQTLLETHLMETALPGQVITQFVASDSDIGNNAAISYTITSGNMTGTFSLDATTGKLYLDKPLDYEFKQTYALNITAEDFGSPRLSSFIRFIVNVDDYNDNAPRFPDSPIMRTVTEGQSAQSPVVKVTASDPDSGINGQLQYSIASQEPSGDHFRIDSQSGMIYVNSIIDREFSDQFNITVVATDMAEPARNRKSAHKSVLIMVSDRNDNSPEFVSMPAVGVAPNAPANTRIMTVSAVDADAELNGKVRYRLVTADRSLFALDSDSGLLYLSAALPSQPLSYELTVRAEDQGVQDPLGQNHSNMKITVFVRSGAANGPSFNQASYGGSVFENMPTNTDIITVSATSTTQSPVKYYITKIMPSGRAQPQYFQIDENTGRISTTKQLDREKGVSFFDVEVYAVESSGAGPKTRSVQVQIELKDKNDTPPKFSKSVYDISLPETQMVGSRVARLTVEDSDVLGEVTLNIVLGNDDGTFRIESTGQISNLKPLDRESRPYHQLKVRASDGVQESFALVNIALTDINDQAPQFKKSSFSFDIPENTPLSTTVASVMATDGDEGRNGQVKYFLASDWGSDVFQLHPTRGTFTLIGHLDFEQVQHYILTVRAVDGGDPSLQTNVTLFMNVLDVNDNVPVFDPMSYQGEVWENTSLGTSILTTVATDTDSGVNARVSYSIVSGDLKGEFSIDATDGVIRTAKRLDRERQATYTLQVMAKDQASPGSDRLNSTAEVIIHVRDVNDEAPVFVSSNITWVKENSEIGQDVFTVSATDRDTGRNSQVEYSLITTNIPFTLGPTDGKLRPRELIDREASAEYQLMIRASDKGSRVLSSTAQLTVMIEDVNDNDPTFDPRHYQKTVGEDIGVGTSLLQVTASDRDHGFNGVVRYFIIDGDDNRDFSMDQSSGTLRVQKSLDYERKSSYRLLIQAEDSGVSVRYDTATVSIGITDVNDNAPVFFHSPYYAYVQENLQSLPVHAIRVSAYDEDSEPNNQVTYTLRDGDRQKFNINSASGEVTVHQTLDREAASDYLLVVIATDSGTPPLTGTGTIKVIVQDANDNTPAFQHQDYFGSVLENLDKYSPVMQVKAVDEDEGMNAEIRYSLRDGAENRFTIDPTTGTIITMTSLDREDQDQYNLVVIATDGGLDPRSATTQVTIEVDDANDNRPQFELPQYSQTILDPTELGNFVLGVTAVDRDSGPNGKVQYVLIGQDSANFQLDPSNGIIRAKSRLTGRVNGRTYSFQVKASDMAENPQTDQTTVTVRFSDGSPNARPQFSSGTASSSLSESVSIGHSVARVQATSTRSSVINYFIAGGNVGKVFSVDLQSGEVTVAKELDYELTHRYNLWIEARDLGNPPLSQYKPLVIEILDENDNVPRFAHQYYNVSIAEDRGDRPFNLKRSVLRVSATDQDSADNGRIVFSISRGNIGNAFEINPGTGEIKTNGEIDRETVPHYSLQVEATDQGVESKRHTASASIDVYIEDVNDNPPQFTRQSAVSIPENTEIGAFILRATSTDNDVGANARVIYSLGQNPGEKFRIDPDSGNITVNGMLDAEVKNVYNIEVMATDLAHRTSTPVTVTIQDVNDNAPVFNKSVFQFNFNEGQNNNAFVGRVFAEDSDITAPNNQFYFTLERPSSIFHLDTNMGNVFSLRSLSFVPPSQGPPSSNQYELDILATDLGVPPKVSKAKVVISVVDANDNAPVFEKSSYFSAVEESVQAQEVVLTLKARDELDFGVNAEVVYFKDGGDGSSLFDVDPVTGAVSVSRSLSGLRNRDLTVVVKAQDKGNPPKFTTANVVLSVTGANQNSPQFSTTVSLERTLPEDTAVGTPVTTIRATDTDTGLNGEVLYSITGGNEKGLFNIDPNTGTVTVASPLDFDSVPTHYINITARDRGFRSRNTTVVFTLKLTDINDNPPVFNQSSYDAYIRENSANGTWVFRAHATDKDSGRNAAIEYSIISDTDARTMFTIESRSGIIRLHGSLDYEVRKTYTMTVLARNPGIDNLRNTTTIVVHVTGQNEYVPHFRRSLYEFTVSKSADSGTPVGSVSATDNDHGEDGVVYYFLVGGSNLRGFKIDMKSGDIMVSGTLARSTASVISLNVLAKNWGSIHGNDTDKCVVRINLQESPSQPCGDYYCENGGQCNTAGGDTVCQCPTTWTGPSCSTDVNECSGNPCKNGGTCRNTVGSFYCECPDDQGGDLCDGLENFCQHQPCLNGGTCENQADRYICLCDFGFWGSECEHQAYSFTEASYLESSSLDAYQNQVVVYFATVQTQALLFFNPGEARADFLALEIIAGKVRFSYAMNSVAEPTRIQVPVSVSDGKWYKAQANRGQQTSSLKVTACPNSGGECDECRNGDPSCHATAVSSGSFNSGGNKLTVGGVRDFSQILERAGKVETFNFVGCMRSLTVEGQDILLPPYINRNVQAVTPGCGRSSGGQCGADSCTNRGQCVDEWLSTRCVCDAEYGGEECQHDWKPVSFGTNTVVSYKVREGYQRQEQLTNAIQGSRKRRSASENSLSVRFLTSASASLLIYTSGLEKFGVLHVKARRLLFTYKLPGYGEEVVTADGLDVTDGEWHEAKVALTGGQFELSVDGSVKNTSRPALPYDLTGSDMLELSLGGAPSNFLVSGQNPTGFVGCVEEFLLDGGRLPFNGQTDRFTIEVKGSDSSGGSCPGAGCLDSSVCAAAKPPPGGLSIGIIIVIVFFAVLIIVIIIIFVVFRRRGVLCWKSKLADDNRIKQNGSAGAKIGSDTGGNRSQDSGYSGDNNELPDEVIIRNHITEQLTLTQTRKVGGVDNPDLPRPDIIGSDGRSTIPLPLEIDDGTVIIENGDLSHIPPHSEDVPEHYDLENASSIAPSDIDVVTHYKGFRDGKIHKYKTNPHVPNYHKNPQQPKYPSGHRNSPMAPSGSGQSRSSPGFPNHPAVGVLGTSSARNSPLAMNNLARSSPAPQSARTTPLNPLSRPNIASSPHGYPINSRGTPVSAGRRTDSERSLSSSSTGHQRPNGHTPRNNRPGSRPGSKSSEPYRAYPTKPPPFKGLTVEEVDRLNARPRGNSPVSMLDAVSSASDDNLMFKLKGPRQPPAPCMLLEPPDSTTDESANDSFTCSEFEYDNDKVRNDFDPGMMIFSKLTEVENENDDHPPEPRPLGEDGRDSRGDSYSTLPSSEEDRFRPQKPLNGTLNWDYLLNWGPSFEKLVGVFKDIALLPDGETGSETQDLSASGKPNQEEYV